MIHARRPVTLAEVREIVEKLEEKQELKDYLKKFSKLTLEKSAKLKEELLSVNGRFKEEDAVKIADFLPKEIEELRKIVLDTSLSEEEANAVLEIVRKY